MNTLGALLVGSIIGISFLLVIVLISESGKQRHAKNKKLFIHNAPQSTIYERKNTNKRR